MEETTEAEAEIVVGVENEAPEAIDCRSSHKRRKVCSTFGPDENSSGNSVSHEPITLSKCEDDDQINVDLKCEDFVTDDDPGSMNNGFIISTRASEDSGDSSMESSSSSSTERKQSPEEATADSRRKLDDGMMAEIEEFFSATEKYFKQQFAEKYNYDIVKDVPLEGRYEWVRLE